MRTLLWLLGAVAGAAIGATLTAAPRRRARRREVHQSSPTAVAAEALRTGVIPMASGFHEEPEIPGEEELLQAGDPDVEALGAAYVGDEVPGGDMSTPDQDGIDDVGRAYGVSEIDEGELRPTFEVLRRRDQRR